MTHTTIARPHLLDRAPDVVNSRITVLVAPPGSGKSTLLDQWTQQLRDTADVVRLNLRFEHNDPPRFQTEILNAAGALFESMPFDSGEIRPTTVPDFVAGIVSRDTPRPLLFVFDQYENITDPIVTDTILSALQLMPPEVTAVFSSRAAPNMLLSEYRSHGELLELSFADLRLRPEEYGELAAQFAPAATSAQIDHIARESLGWMIAALHLLQQNPHRLDEYIDDEVLTGFGLTGRKAAEEAAVTETVTAAQASALLGLNRDEHLSEAVDFWGIQLPLTQNPDAETWRFPPVLRERLRWHLERRDPQRFDELSTAGTDERETAPELTPVEYDVLRLLADGLTAAAAARTLGITFLTVKTHIRSLYEKLGVSTRASALHRAGALGMLDTDGDPAHPDANATDAGATE